MFNCKRRSHSNSSLNSSLPVEQTSFLRFQAWPTGAYTAGRSPGRWPLETRFVPAAAPARRPQPHRTTAAEVQGKDPRAWARRRLGGAVTTPRSSCSPRSRLGSARPGFSDSESGSRPLSRAPGPSPRPERDSTARKGSAASNASTAP